MSRSSGMFSTDVWERQHGFDALGERAYVFLLNLWILLGLGATAWAAHAAQGFQPGWWMVAMIVLAFGGAFVTRSDSALVSLAGYFAVAGSFGCLLGPVVAAYSAASLFKAVGVTFLVSGSLGTVGVIFPNLLRGFGAYLFAGLSLLLFGQIFALMAAPFELPVSGALTALDWIGAGLFSLYLVYDYGRAMTVARTLDNSVDCACAIYLDVLNLFVRILSLIGDRD